MNTKFKGLATDESVANLVTEQAFLEACEHYSNPDFWKPVFANEMRCFGVSNMPILAKSIIEDKGMEETVSEEIFNENCGGERANGLFTAVPTENGKYENYANRVISYPSLHERSGTACRMITTIKSSNYITALSAEERGEEVNRGWQTSSEPLKVYIPDGKISFYGSSVYVILPFIEGYDAVKEELTVSYPNHKYRGGQIDHSYIYGEWTLNSDEEESYALMLEELGAIKKGEKTPFTLRYSTSNVGNAKMSVRLLVEIGGTAIPLGKPQSIWHHNKKAVVEKEKLTADNGCSIEDFKTKLTWLGNILKENEDIIENLGNTEIEHPTGCLQHILADMHTISAKDKKKALDDMQTLYPDKCTAIDVYLMLSSIVGFESRSPRTVVNMTEEIAEMQFRNFKLYDKKFVAED